MHSFRIVHKVHKPELVQYLIVIDFLCNCVLCLHFAKLSLFFHLNSVHKNKNYISCKTCHLNVLKKYSLKQFVNDGCLYCVNIGTYCTSCHYCSKCSVALLFVCIQ